MQAQILLMYIVPVLIMFVSLTLILKKSVLVAFGCSMLKEMKSNQ